MPPRCFFLICYHASFAVFLLSSFFIFLNFSVTAFILAKFPLISPKKYEKIKPIISINIAITDSIFVPNTQLLFKTLGIIDINKPNIIENVPV